MISGDACVCHDDGAVVLLQTYLIQIGTKGLVGACTVHGRAWVCVSMYSTIPTPVSKPCILSPSHRSQMLIGFLKLLLNNLLFYSLNVFFFILRQEIPIDESKNEKVRISCYC